jgi:hypothetical protein
MNEGMVRAVKSGGLVDAGMDSVDRTQLAKLPVNYTIETKRSDEERTWYEAREEEFFREQDATYLPIREAIVGELRGVQKKLKELMKVNEERDNPLAKLKEHEFYLDLDELERLNKEADSQILAVLLKSIIKSFYIVHNYNIKNWYKFR